MMLAAEILDQSVAGWAVGFVMLAITGALGFLVRNAFDGTTKAVEGLDKKLDAITARQANSDGDLREFKAEMRADLKALIARVDQVERIQREIA